MNRQMQEQCSLVHELLEAVGKLKRQFANDLVAMERGSFEEFAFIGCLNDVQRATFCDILKHLLFNIDVRFPNISTSIDTRIVQENTDRETLELDETISRRMRRKCPFLPPMGVFLIPDDLIKHGRINEYFVGGRFPEIERFAREIVERKEEIVRNVESSNDAHQASKPITLLDVFQILNRTSYPFLWDVVLRAVAVLPTTASCEQNFSRLKHKLHENMLKENAFCLLRMVQKHATIQFGGSQMQ